MKIKCTLISILMFCSALSFNACFQKAEKDYPVEILFLLNACGVGGKYDIGCTGPSGVGIVFYITDGGKHGLEVAPEDQSAGMAWSTITNVLVNGVTPLPIAIGTGSANTDAIIAQNGGAVSAAKTCRDYTGGGLTDWFLPSLNELYTMKNNLIYRDIGNLTINAHYWSSSEYNYEGAWNQWFGYNNDTQVNDFKGTTGERVRAVRAF